MRLILVVFVSLALGCSKSKQETPATAEPTPAATPETEAAAEAGEAAATATPLTPLKEVKLPPELQGPTPPSSEPPSLKVLEAGSDPSHQLRWAVKPGFEQTLSMKIRFGVGAVIGGVLSARAPDRSAVYTLTLKGDKVGPDGALRVAFTIDELEARYETGSNETQKDRLKKAVARVRGLRGGYTLDPQGGVKTVELNAPPAPDASQEVHGMVADVKWALHQLARPFPKERVGKGAQWTAHRGVMQEGVLVSELSTMEITKLQGTRVDVKTKFKQSAQAQTFQMPGQPTPMELSGLFAEGQSEFWWDLTKLAPKTASVMSTTQKAYRFEQADAQPADMLALTSRTLTIPGK